MQVMKGHKTEMSHLFQRLDRASKSYLTYSDFRQFLNEYTPNETINLKALVKTKRIKFSQFVKFCLPKVGGQDENECDNTLTEEPVVIRKIDTCDPRVEVAFADLLGDLARLTTEVKGLQRELKQRIDLELKSVYIEMLSLTDFQ